MLLETAVARQAHDSGRLRLVGRQEQARSDKSQQTDESSHDRLRFVKRVSLFPIPTGWRCIACRWNSHGGLSMFKCIFPALVAAVALLALSLFMLPARACCPAGHFGLPVVNADQAVIIVWDPATQ